MLPLPPPVPTLRQPGAEAHPRRPLEELPAETAQPQPPPPPPRRAGVLQGAPRPQRVRPEPAWGCGQGCWVSPAGDRQPPLCALYAPRACRSDLTASAASLVSSRRAADCACRAASAACAAATSASRSRADWRRMLPAAASSPGKASARVRSRAAAAAHGRPPCGYPLQFWGARPRPEHVPAPQLQRSTSVRAPPPAAQSAGRSSSGQARQRTNGEPRSSSRSGGGCRSALTSWVGRNPRQRVGSASALGAAAEAAAAGQRGGQVRGMRSPREGTCRVSPRTVRGQTDLASLRPWGWKRAGGGSWAREARACAPERRRSARR